MIKISSFSIIQNFSRWIWEFDDNKIAVKIKSLTVEHERDVPYAKIRFIINKSSMDMEWVWVSFIIVALLSLTRAGLAYFCIVNPVIAIIEKLVVIFALVVAFFLFRKREYYWFFDEDKNILAGIWIAKKNKPMLLNAIRLIKQKNENIHETYFDDSIPTIQPVFQLEELDVADSWNKRQINFYQDSIIVIEKSLEEEMTTNIKYDELSGETKFLRINNEKWGVILMYWAYLLATAITFVEIFFTQQTKGNLVFVRFIIACFVSLTPLLILRYIKNDALIFLDKKDNAVLWITINAQNREKVNQIIEFIQNKTGFQR